MPTKFDKLEDLCKQYKVYELCRPVLDMPKFQICSGSGSPHSHHYGDNGLVEHTLEVIDLCLLNNAYFLTSDPTKAVDTKKIVVAAFFHDVGKVHDYIRHECPDCGIGEYVWECSSHKKLIHHISRSIMMFRDCVRLLTNRVIEEDEGYGQSELGTQISWLTIDVVDEIIHAILAHHGAKEYGSPVLPQTRLAWLLHLCDGISARMDDCLRRSK